MTDNLFILQPYISLLTMVSRFNKTGYYPIEIKMSYIFSNFLVISKSHVSLKHVNTIRNFVNIIHEIYEHIFATRKTNDNEAGIS